MRHQRVVGLTSMLLAKWLNEIVADEPADQREVQLPSNSIFSHGQRAVPAVDNQIAEEADGGKADVPWGISQQPKNSCEVAGQNDEMGCYD